MGVRLKYLLIILAIFLGSSLVIWVATETLVRSQYENIENNNLKKDTSRATNALQNRVDQIAQKAPDWSSWDDTYEFIDDTNQSYIDSNLQPESLQSLDINYMMFIDAKGQIKYSTGIDIKSGEEMAIPPELKKIFEPDSSFLAKNEDDSFKGIINTSNSPLILTATPIITSALTGPVKGTLVFARYLDNSEVSRIGDLTQLDINIAAAVDKQGVIKPEAQSFSSSEVTTIIYGKESMAGYAIINDIFGKPLLLLSVQEPRTIFQQTQKTLIFYIAVVSAASLVAIIAVLFVANKLIVKDRAIEIERSSKKEVERQVIERTKEAEEEEARLHSAMDSLSAGLLITFKDTGRVSFNPALVNILNLRETIERLNQSNAVIDLGQILNMLRPINNFELGTKIDKCQNHGESFEIREVEYAGRVVNIFGAPVMLKLDKIIGAVILVEDVTESKKLERSKDEFFSIASHELRTPLTAIQGNSSMIIEYFKDSLNNKDVEEMIEDIQESSIRLIEIVNDFLDVSRLEQGKIRFVYEPVDAAHVVDNVAYEMKNELKKKGNKMEVDQESFKNIPKVNADKDRLKQVIYNLVGNSAKFTENGKISVSASQQGNNVKISVSDTGRGMDDAAQQLLFQKFQQTNQSILTRDTTKGTGLGLYISKMIVESMGGKIYLESSQIGKGTTFSFIIPTFRENPPMTQS